MKKLIQISIAIAILLPNIAFSQQTDIKKQVHDIVQGAGDRIITIAADKNLNEHQRVSKIIEIVDGVTDPDWIARFVLGKNYRTATAEQKDKFISTYRKFMSNTYGPKFRSFDGKKFEVKSVTDQGGIYVAKSEFLPRTSNQPVSVNFRVIKKGEKLCVIDFVVEGISMLETQRSEFSSAISRMGLDAFLSNLEQRVSVLNSSKQ